MKEQFNQIIALIMVIGFFTIVGIMLFHEIPQGSKDMLGPLIGGIIGASVSTIVQYMWGSSSGSAKKTELIDAMTGTGDGTSKTVATVKTDITKVVTTEPPKEQPKGETP